MYVCRVLVALVHALTRSITKMIHMGETQPLSPSSSLRLLCRFRSVWSSILYSMISDSY